MVHRCKVCHNLFDTYEEARGCAEDHVHNSFICNVTGEPIDPKYIDNYGLAHEIPVR